MSVQTIVLRVEHSEEPEDVRDRIDEAIKAAGEIGKDFLATEIGHFPSSSIDVACYDLILFFE